MSWGAIQRFLVALLFCAATGGLGPSASEAPESADPGRAFRRLAEGYIEAYLATYPVRATELGVHDHDARLRDLSRNAIRERVRELHAWLELFEGIDATRLTGDDSLDHRVVDHAIRAELLELEQVARWRRDPMLYDSQMSEGVASLVDRQFAPLEQRLDHLISRLDQYPDVIRAARKNLRDVPVEWTDLAVKNTRGHLKFLRKDVTAALIGQGLHQLGPEPRGRWVLARQRAVEQLERYSAWLERELRPRSHGSFRLGREMFERKLLYEQHVSLSVDELITINETAIAEYQAWVAREAARVDPEATVEQVMRDLVQQHPKSDELIPTAQKNVEQARRFIREQGLLTLPTDALPIIRPMPEYARSGFASMSTPGPFETHATEAYYNITGVDPSWSPEQQRQHLTYFNYPGLLGISIHEAMPGHFIQLLYQRELPTDVRKVFTATSLVEGWAHYAEQMMIDEGFGGGDPAIRLGQLRRALQRHARWYAGVALNTSGTSISQAAKRFAEIAYFAPFPAMRETLRGTYDPTYLVYALGRMQILELREDYKRYLEDRGKTFSLREFHDRFLRLGLPVPLAREVLIPEADAGTRAISD